MSAAWAAAPRRWTRLERLVLTAKAGPVDQRHADRNRPGDRRALSLALAAGLRLQGAASR